MALKLPSLKLTQKAALLILGPLLLQFVFLGALIINLKQAEKETEAEAHAAMALAYLNMGTNEALAATFSLAYFRAFHEENALEDYKLHVKNFDRHRNEMAALAEIDTFQRPELLKLVSHFDSTKSILLESVELAKSGGFIEGIHTLGKVKGFVNQINREGTELIERQTAAHQHFRENQLRSRDQLRWTIAVGSAFNLLLALFLALMLNKTFAGRMHVLMSNTMRIAGGKPLELPLSGTDELAALDGVIHKLSTDLALSRQRERDVLAMVSHDLRSAMTSLGITLDLLVDGHLGTLNERGDRMIDRASRSVALLQDMIQDLLEVERLEAGMFVLNYQSTPISTTIQQAVDMVHAQAEGKEIKLESSITETTVDVDPDRMRRVLLNLLGNAIKFSPAGGVISINATDISAPEETTQVEVRVNDQGPGIPQDQAELIFEKFRQLERSGKPERQGSGLGLAICKAIVEAHGGKIGVEAAAGGGSSFWFRIPVTSASR